MPGMGKTSKGINYDIIRPDKQSGGKYTPGYKPHLSIHNKGGRVGKQLGGAEGNTRPITGTQRFDQSRGYYQPDMGMRGGAMYNKGGRIGLKRGSPRTERDAAKAELHRAQIKSNGSHYTTTLGGFPIRSDWHKAIKKHEKKFPKLVKNIKYNTKKDFKKVKPSPQRRADGGRVGLKGGGEDKWIQKATKGMRKDKPCTGKKFGGASCPPGSKRYNLAKTFKKMAKKRKS